MKTSKTKVKLHHLCFLALFAVRSDLGNGEEVEAHIARALPRRRRVNFQLALLAVGNRSLDRALRVGAHAAAPLQRRLPARVGGAREGQRLCRSSGGRGNRGLGQALVFRQDLILIAFPVL